MPWRGVRIGRLELQPLSSQTSPTAPSCFSSSYKAVWCHPFTERHLAAGASDQHHLFGSQDTGFPGPLDSFTLKDLFSFY